MVAIGTWLTPECAAVLTLVVLALRAHVRVMLVNVLMVPSCTDDLVHLHACVSVVIVACLQ